MFDSIRNIFSAIVRDAIHLTLGNAFGRMVLFITLVAFIVITLIGSLVPGVTHAADIYVCKGADGVTEFRQVPCGASLDTHAKLSGYGAVNSGIRFNANAPQGGTQIAKHRGRAYEPRRRTLGYGDKTRLRELRMDRDAAVDAVGRLGSGGLGNLGKADAYRQQIQDLNREMNSIRTNPTGH